MTTIVLNKVLTYKEWSLQKNIISALGAGGTGIGAALKTLEADFQKVNWFTVDPDRASTLTPRTFDSAHNFAKPQLQKLVGVEAAAKNVVTTATKAEAALKTNKIVPDVSKKYVTKIKDEAHKLELAISGLDAAWATERAEVVAHFASNRQNFNKMRAPLKALGATAKQGDDKAVENFADSYGMLLRMVRGMIGVMSGSHDTEDEVLQNYRKDHLETLRDAPADKTKVSAWVDSVLGALDKFDDLLKVP